MIHRSETIQSEELIQSRRSYPCPSCLLCPVSLNDISDVTYAQSLTAASRYLDRSVLPYHRFSGRRWVYRRSSDIDANEGKPSLAELFPEDEILLSPEDILMQVLEKDEAQASSQAESSTRRQAAGNAQDREPAF